MPWRAVITRPVPRPATAGPAPPAAHLLFPPGREHQHPGGEPAWPGCSPPAGRIGRPSCGGAGRSVNCSGPGISAALDLPEDQPNPGIPQVKAAQGMPSASTAPDPCAAIGTAPGTARRRCASHDRPLPQPPQQVGGLAAATQPGQRRWAARAPPGQPRRLRPQPRGQTACSTSPPYTSGSSGCSRSARRLNSWNPGSASCSLCAA